MHVSTGLEPLKAVFGGGSTQELMALNACIHNEAFVITPKDAAVILQKRQDVLNTSGRLELNLHVTASILQRLSSSAYADQETYADIAGEIYEIFHDIKNETSDLTCDDEILDALFDAFEGKCGGSTELLSAKGAKRIIRQINRSAHIDDTEGPHDF